MRKFIAIVIATVISISALSAQGYKWGAGIRAGGHMSGVSLQYNIDGVNGVEGILSIPYKGGFTATALYERFVPVISHGFYFYYGLGGHVGKWDKKFALGVDAITGLEYRIPSVPLAVSLDYKPVFNIASRTKFYLFDFGLAIRVRF